MLNPLKIIRGLPGLPSDVKISPYIFRRSMIDPKDTVQLSSMAMPDFKLSEDQRAILSAYAQTEGFDLTQKLMLNAIRDFNHNLMNTPSTKPEEILAKHAAAQTATLFYQEFMVRLSDELNLHKYNAMRLGTMDNPEISEVAQDFQ
jgi:hypothetical protein